MKEKPNLPKEEVKQEQPPEKKIIPPPVVSRATIESKPHAFYVQQQGINQKRLSEREEYQDLKDKIADAEIAGKREIHHKGDLRDYAWQTLSQEGFRLQRTVDPENPNNINFYIRW